MSKKGFTLIELIMVIVILGIIAVVAIPRYVDLRSQAELAAIDGVVGGVRGGIHTYYAESAAIGRTPLFPASLEGVDADTVFEGVLTDGVEVSAGNGWSIAGNVYTYTAGADTEVYEYIPATGALTRTSSDLR